MGDQRKPRSRWREKLGYKNFSSSKTGDQDRQIFREERSIGGSYWRWATLGPDAGIVTWKKFKASLSSGVITCKIGLLIGTLQLKLICRISPVGVAAA